MLLIFLLRSLLADTSEEDVEVLATLSDALEDITRESIMQVNSLIVRREVFPLFGFKWDKDLNNNCQFIILS